VKNFVLLFAILCLSVSNSFCWDIIPKPKTEKPEKELCGLNPTWKWMAGPDSTEAIRSMYRQFERWADTSAIGYFKPLDLFEKCPRVVNILIDKNIKTGTEGYQIRIKKEEIVVSAKTVRGLFYGLVSLKQLVFPLFKERKPFTCGTILDEPRFGWRGMHLDVSRHFFSVREVETYIEMLALHKMNVFHWHLTDDQGWRMEVKAFPKLTEVGAYRPQTMNGHHRDKPRTFDGKPYGGFYTQDQIRHIVQYASERMITVIPEIEMPGHCQEMIAAYPELASKDTTTEVMTVWGGTDHILNPFPPTFRFLEKVLDETMALFPSAYIHVGGDEAMKKHWRKNPRIQKFKDSLKLKNEDELQSWFIQQIDHYLVSKGRKLMGWDEILEGGLAQNAAVMSWQGEKGGIEAAKMKHYVVMSPGTHCYFDHYQHEPKSEEPLAIGGLTTLEKVYSYDPQPAVLTADEKKYIMGAQGNVWTEYIQTFSQVQYMVLPRMAALCEVVWTEVPAKNYPGFKQRLQPLSALYGAQGWNWCRKEMP
jgi:hexosaminidase